MLDRIRIVLCGTTHPGNIGAAARAMKTMGLERLVLVAPHHYPSAEATARASGADDLLLRAQVVETVNEALEGVRYAVGTSARLRRIPLPELDPRKAAETACRRAADGDVAILFGREKSGLSNAEIDRCQALLHIPTSNRYNSLNLGAAVQVVCYELRMRALEGHRDAPGAERVPAELDKMERFYQHLEQALLDIEFLDPRQPTVMLQRLRRLFNRAAPDDTELHILRGILSRAQRAAGYPPARE